MYITEEFVKQYEPMVHARVHSRLKKKGLVNTDLLETIPPLVWERVLKSDNYDTSKGALSTWLYYIIESVISNEIKKKAVSQDALDHSLPLEVANNVIGVEDAGDAKDELTRVFAAAELTRRDEGIMRDIHLEGYTYEETADRHGMGLEAVKKVAYRAMKALRDTVG